MPPSSSTSSDGNDKTSSSRTIDQVGAAREGSVSEDWSADVWRRLQRNARRRAVAWSIRRTALLPVLMVAGLGSALQGWSGFLAPVGLALAPFYALAALGVHFADIVKSLGGEVEILFGEVLGRVPLSYDGATYGFMVGRKHAFLVDCELAFSVTNEGHYRNASIRPEPRSLRATRRASRALRVGDHAGLLIVNERVLDRCDRLTLRRADELTLLRSNEAESVPPRALVARTELPK